MMKIVVMEMSRPPKIQDDSRTHNVLNTDRRNVCKKHKIIKDCTSNTYIDRIYFQCYYITESSSLSVISNEEESGARFHTGPACFFISTCLAQWCSLVSLILAAAAG